MRILIMRVSIDMHSYMYIYSATPFDVITFLYVYMYIMYLVYMYIMYHVCIHHVSRIYTYNTHNFYILQHVYVSSMHVYGCMHLLMLLSMLEIYFFYIHTACIFVKSICVYTYIRVCGCHSIFYFNFKRNIYIYICMRILLMRPNLSACLPHSRTYINK